jgi:hypothetical protein
MSPDKEPSAGAKGTVATMMSHTGAIGSENASLSASFAQMQENQANRKKYMDAKNEEYKAEHGQDMPPAIRVLTMVNLFASNAWRALGDVRREMNAHMTTGTYAEQREKLKRLNDEAAQKRQRKKQRGLEK